MSTTITMSKAHRRVMQIAEEEARSLHDNHINTHHIVLAMTRDTESKAGEILRRNGITTEFMRRQIVSTMGFGETPNPTRFYHDDDIRRVIIITLKIAEKYQHKEVYPEHFLLALLIYGWSPGAGILRASWTSKNDPEGRIRVADVGLQLKEVIEQLT